jgi:hypothetical protein
LGLLAACNEISATCARLLGYLAALAVLAAFAAKLLGITGVEAAVPTVRSEWVALERPHRAFALLLLEFPNEPEPSYTILRHVAGGGRKDVMSWPNSAEGGSALRIEIYRPGKEVNQSSPSMLAELSAEGLGTITPIRSHAPIASKFGELALAEFTARRQEQTRRCLAFGRAFEAPPLRIAGWYCKGNDEIVESSFVACALDRLTVIAAGSDPRVAELFAKAELARQFCHPKGNSRSATLRHHDWLSASPDPKLRGRFITR